MANRYTNGNGRGFAGMDPDRQREIAAMGGRAAHESGHAHEWNSDEAAEAGRLGGIAAHRAAAFHHDSAAYHHRQAARHRLNGNHEVANLHGEQAARHGRKAMLHTESARRASARGGTHEQHVKAGRLGAEARWGHSSDEHWGQEENRTMREDDIAPREGDDEGEKQ
jgi:general stress protein YciG